MKARIAYLENEVVQTEKLMSQYVLDKEGVKNLQSRCVIQSYKSKLVTYEKKVELLKQKTKDLKKENKEL